MLVVNHVIWLLRGLCWQYARKTRDPILRLSKRNDEVVVGSLEERRMCTCPQQGLLQTEMTTSHPPSRRPKLDWLEHLSEGLGGCWSQPRKSWGNGCGEVRVEGQQIKKRNKLKNHPLLHTPVKFLGFFFFLNYRMKWSFYPSIKSTPQLNGKGNLVSHKSLIFCDF